MTAVERPALTTEAGAETETAAERLARFTTELGPRQLTDDLRESVRYFLLDHLANALGGSTAPSSAPVYQLVAARRGACQVIGGPADVAPEWAALANGTAGAPDAQAFERGLREACESLALQMARDAEGHTKVVTIVIEDAATEEEAERAARKLAGSLLVKSSFYGSDPYWGRVLSDLGTAGVSIDVDTVTIAYDDIIVSAGRAPTGADASHVAQQAEFRLTCRLGAGQSSYFVHTNDLSHAYIDENMGTS